VIKPWVFEFFPAPREPGATTDPQRSADYFNWYLDLWPRAERLGYEGIFFSEHHFGPAYSPAPNLLIAQIALKTRTIRLGVMGLVLPYHQPWKIVEEIGMLDHLTQGRLEIGTAAGIPQEMARVGMSVEEARERNDEASDILDAFLAGPVVTHHGKYWHFDELRLVPRPIQRPAPPLWVTVVSEDSARKAARRGAKICTGFHPLDRVASIFDAYRDEAARVGTPRGRNSWRCGGRLRSAAATAPPATPRAPAKSSSAPISCATRVCRRPATRSSTRRFRTPSRSAATSSSPVRRKASRATSSRNAATAALAIFWRSSTAPRRATNWPKRGNCSAPA
jgi:Luciferase-like monooxygenase